MEHAFSDVQKLRRFALVVGMTVLAWLVLGVNPKNLPEMDPSSNQAETGELSVPYLGNILNMSRAQYIPWFLIVVSLYAGGTYFYHAVLREDTPKRFREATKTHSASKIPKFQKSINFSDEKQAMDFDYKMRRAFPRVRNQGYESAITNRHNLSMVNYTVPPVSEATARFHDADYHLPWVLNAVVLGVWLLIGIAKPISASIVSIVLTN